jgi:hypothetical protein
VPHLLAGNDLAGDETLLDEQGALANVPPLEREYFFRKAQPRIRSEGHHQRRVGTSLAAHRVADRLNPGRLKADDSTFPYA